MVLHFLINLKKNSNLRKSTENTNNTIQCEDKYAPCPQVISTQNSISKQEQKGQPADRHSVRGEVKCVVLKAAIDTEDLKPINHVLKSPVD